MRTGLIVAGAALGLIAASYLTKRAADQAAEASADTETGNGSTVIDYFNPWGYIEANVNEAQARQAVSDTNVRAGLDVIAWAEGTERAADPYRVCYSYRHTIRDLAEHPAVSGEWKGEPLDSLGPRYAGLVSTAAGRYQIIKRTWLSAKRALGLVDFSPESQDAAAVYLIKQRGALEDLQRGDLQAFCDKCAPEWASLPGSTSGQPQRKFAQLLDVFNQAGGTFA